MNFIHSYIHAKTSIRITKKKNIIQASFLYKFMATTDINLILL